MSWRRALLAPVLIICVGALFWAGPRFSNSLLTLRLLVQLNRAADGKLNPEGVKTLDLSETRSDGGRTLRGRLYLPWTTSDLGIVFLPGLTRQGYDHPRFVAVAQALVHTGFAVLTPDIQALKEFQMDQTGVDETIFWADWWLHRSPHRIRRVGILGVSVGGTLGLKAAANLREKVSFVVSIGGYQDLDRCQKGWFGRGDSTLRHGDYPVRYYGKWICMLTFLDGLELNSDRKTLKKILNNLIEKGRLEKNDPDLSAEGRRWLQIATQDATPYLLETTLGSHAEQFQSLSAGTELRRIQCPVFLIHGLHDDLIPVSEALQLQKLLIQAPTSVLLTPLISHTHPLWQKLSDFRKCLALLRLSCFLHEFVSITAPEP